MANVMLMTLVMLKSIWNDLLEIKITKTNEFMMFLLVLSCMVTLALKCIIKKIISNLSGAIILDI